MTPIEGPAFQPIIIDPGRFDIHGDDLKRELLSVREEADEDLSDRLAGTDQGDRPVTAAEAIDWHRTLCDIIDKLLAGNPFALHTPTECCAFTTVLHEAVEDMELCLENELDGVVLPECVAPLCAFADYDEFEVDEDDDEDDDLDDRLPIRHPMRRWRVTVTLEQVIDRTDHPCDPDTCPLEVTLRKRVTFKTIIGRTRRHAEGRALDLFEVTHKTREGAEYWAEANLITETADSQAPGSTSPAAIPRREDGAP
jgi:hypothetical protein